ncbi:MAG: tetratricopeptide repeat protein [Terriglobales bacterium]
MRKRGSVLLSSPIVAVLILALLGCAKSQFALGSKLEAKGRFNDALSAYQSSLTQTSSGNHRQISQTYYRMGECLLRLDRMPEAFHAFQLAIESDSANVAAHLRIGEFMVSAGLAQGAQREAEMALRVDPRNSEAVVLMGAAFEKMGDKRDAITTYEKALSLDPKRPAAAVALADLYNQDDQTQKAQQVLENAAKANPKTASPLLALGRLHEQEGEISGAESAYRAAVKAEDTPDTNLRLAQFLQRTSRIAEAAQVLRRVDSLQPTSGTELADFELISGRPLTALRDYQTALQQQKPATNTAARQERARVATRLVEADLEVAADNPAELANAIEHARDHLKQYSADIDDATRNILEAEISLASNDLPAASGHAQEAVLLAPDSAPAHYVAGLVRLRCSDPSDARSEWLKALDSDPHFAPARVALGEQALSENDVAGAESYVLAVVRDEPANIRALDLFARVLAAKQSFSSAATIARRMEALEPDSAEPHVLLGNIEADAGRPGDALIEFEHAVVIDPHSSSAVEGLTRVYRTGKLTRPMLLRIERVASAKPASAVLMEIAGRLFADHHWYADAKRCLSEALRMDPKRATAAAALADTFAETGDLSAAADSAAKTGGNAAALLAGVKAEESNDVRSAIDNYERAVRGGESSGVAANNLAWLYAEQGANLGRALQLAQAAESLSPGNPAVLDTVGVVHLRRREYSEAVRTLEAARQLSRTTAQPPQLTQQIRRHLAEAYMKAGNTAAAQAVGTGSPASSRTGK